MHRQGGVPLSLFVVEVWQVAAGYLTTPVTAQSYTCASRTQLRHTENSAAPKIQPPKLFGFRQCKCFEFSDSASPGNPNGFGFSGDGTSLKVSFSHAKSC